jgi:hypothetical protein
MIYSTTSTTTITTVTTNTTIVFTILCYHDFYRTLLFGKRSFGHNVPR